MAKAMGSGRVEGEEGRGCAVGASVSEGPGDKSQKSRILSSSVSCVVSE